MHATGRPNSAIAGDLVTHTVRTGFGIWPWPRWWRRFRDDDPGIVELVTGSGADQAALALNAVREAGAEVSATLGGPDVEVAEPGFSGAPLVSVLRKAIDRFNYGDHSVRFPRTRLVARLADLELGDDPSTEKIDALLRALRLYWARPDTDDGQQQNVIAAVLRAAPNPVSMIVALIAGFARRNFQLWFWGVPGIGPGCRWLRQQRKPWLRRLRRVNAGGRLPGVGFKTYALRLTPQSRRERPFDVELLAAKAFLEDLRAAYRPRLWNPRTWERYFHPALILDGLDDTLPGLFDRARAEARREGQDPDPLLVVLVPHATLPAHEFACPVVRELGNPGDVTVQRPRRPWLALATSLVVTLGIPAAAALLAVSLVPATQPVAARPVSFPRTATPSPAPSQRPRPITDAVLSPPCRTAAVLPGEASATVFNNTQPNATVKDIECVGYSSTAAAIFLNQQVGPPPPDQETQDQRVKSDETEIFQANKEADASGRPETGLVYFAGLTEGSGEDYDSAEAEELEGLLAAQRIALQGPQEDPVLKIFIANGGSEMKDAVTVANMLLPLFDDANALEPGVDMLGVVGMDRSTTPVENAIKILTAHEIPVLATTLSADTFDDLSPYYFSLSPPNMSEARLMLEYVKDAVPQYFSQPASKYYSAGSAAPRQITIYEPGQTQDDEYLATLVNDLETLAPQILGRTTLPVVHSYEPSELCGADTVDIYIGRHDRPLSASANSLDDFGTFMENINTCPKTRDGKPTIPFVIADDGVTRFVADPAARLAGVNGDEPVSYVTKGISVIGTGSECLGGNAAKATNLPANFCSAYAGIVAGLTKQLGASFKLYWTGERVGLAYDAAEIFLHAETRLENSAPTRTQVRNEFEAPGGAYTGVTGTVEFTPQDHTGTDAPGAMPLAIVRIDLSASTAMPTCGFTESNAPALGPGPNASKNPPPDICPVSAG